MASLIISKTSPKSLISQISKTLILSRQISTFPPLSQQPQFQDPPPSQFPSKPSSGSPFYQENWRNPNPNINPEPAPLPSSSASLVPVAYHDPRLMAFSQTLDAKALMDVFADWMTSQRWSDLKQLFEFWVRSLDASGKPNRPDVGLFNHYLRANFMEGATAGELLDLVAEMEKYDIAPDTASYNLVLKAMHKARESDAADKLVDRMMLTGTMPDDETYNLVIDLLISTDQVDSALKYLDMVLKYRNTVSLKVFQDCVQSCLASGRLDTLSSIIEKCKTTDQNKALCPPWKMCNYIADMALQADHSKLAYFALEFFARWMIRGENARPAVLLSVDEGLIVSALSTAGRTYNPLLIDASWSILKRSLREKKAPNPETFLSKIYAYASLGNLQRAFSTLSEFESVYGNSEDSADFDGDLFSPFTSLYPLVVACCKNGFTSLDSVYVQLENLSQAEAPYKSVAALNVVILGCSNVWDLDRAYATYEAIEKKIGLAPNVHSYNALLSGFAKGNKTDEAANLFQHLLSKEVKPNSMTYTLLAEAHLINRDPKAALNVIDQMVEAGFTPSKDLLRKVRRRCSRQFDFDSNEKVGSLARTFEYRMPPETRREMLYNIRYSENYQ